MNFESVEGLTIEQIEKMYEDILNFDDTFLSVYCNAYCTCVDGVRGVGTSSQGATDLAGRYFTKAANGYYASGSCCYPENPCRSHDNYATMYVNWCR